MKNRKELLKEFKKQKLTSKEEVLEFIDKMIRVLNKYSRRDNIRSSSYYYTVNKILDEFRNRVTDSKLIENIDDFWCYDIDYDQRRIELVLQYFDVKEEKGKITENCEEVYRLIIVTAGLLTVEEFAELHDVGVGTVRQWIRRGKIRTAIKEGKEWRIPELTEKPTRGYKSVTYGWLEELVNLPEQYNYMNEYSFVQLEQDDNDKKRFTARFFGELEKKRSVQDKEHTIELNRKEVENFELFLITHSQILYLDSSNELWPEVFRNDLSKQQITET